MAKGVPTKLDRVQSAINGLAIVAGLASALWQGPLWALGAFAGGAAAALNFAFLRHTVEGLMGDGGGKGRMAVLYVFKLLLVGAILVGLIRGLRVPYLPVLLGVGALPLGIVLETVWTSLSPLPEETEGES